MTVRREIAEPRRETGARSPEDPMHTRAVRGGSEGRARRPEARRSNGSAIVAEVFMNNVGELSLALSRRPRLGSQDSRDFSARRSLLTCP